MIVFLVRTFSSDLKGWAIRKVMERGGGGCRNILFRMKDIFSGLLAVHEFFSLNFPWRDFFCTSPPHNFSNGPSPNDYALLHTKIYCILSFNTYDVYC